jgi:DNA-binding NtrC family response regulator
MRRLVLVAGSNHEECRALCAALKRNNYPSVPLHSLSALSRKIREKACAAVILDLDNLCTDNHFIIELCRRNPDVCVIGISGRTFHPELEEAIGKYLSACIGKPVKTDELVYWLKSVCEKGAGPEPHAAAPENAENAKE